MNTYNHNEINLNTFPICVAIGIKITQLFNLLFLKKH